MRAAVTLVLLLLAPPSAIPDVAPAPNDGPDDLMLEVDPANDDWEPEARAQVIGWQLERLAQLLGRGGFGPVELEPLAVPDARATRLRLPPAGRRRLTGGIEINRRAPVAESDEVTLPLLDALRELLAVYPPSSRPRFRFEIDGISDSPEPPFSTQVRFTAAGRTPLRRNEQAARWEVTWSGGTPLAPPRIEAVRLRAADEAGVEGPVPFTECGGGVLSPASAAHALVRHGAEHWYGRIDAIGEPHVLGHNGIAIGDVNGDGRDDLYAALGTGLPNLLLVQNADGTATDIAERAGVAWLDDTKGVLFADTDNDGDQDLLTAIGPTIVLAKNDGAGTFGRFVSLRAPGPAPFHMLTVTDYDTDGDLDVFGVRYMNGAYGSSIPVPLHDAGNGPGNILLRNDGQDRFTDVTRESGLAAGPGRFGVAAAWQDYDADGDPDLFIAGDFGGSALYRNQGGRFEPGADRAGLALPGSASGASWADYDLDGDFDLLVTGASSAAGRRIGALPRFQSRLEPSARRAVQRLALGNALLSNEGSRGFVDVADRAGVRNTGRGWGGAFVDLNGDGWEDLVVPNGFLTGGAVDDLESFFWRQVAARSPAAAAAEPGEQRAYLEGWNAVGRLIARGASWNGRQRVACSMNLGDGTFVEAGHALGIDWPGDARAVAVTDWDGDGDLDLWLRSRTGPQLRFLRNDISREGRFLALRLEGTSCNRDAVGATVTVHLASGRRLSKTRSAGDGHLSQSSPWLHFGFGRAETVERVVIHWPGSTVEVLEEVVSNRRLHVKQGTGRAVPAAPREAVIPVVAMPASGSGPTRVLLRVPLAAPPTVRAVAGPPGRAKLLSLWAQWCPPCITELRGFAGRYSELHGAGLDVVAVDVDAAENQASAALLFAEQVGSLTSEPRFASRAASPELQASLAAILEHVLGFDPGSSLPLSLLFDPHGQLQLVYLGPADVDQLVEDVGRWATVAASTLAPERRTLTHGRWYYRTGRDWRGLAEALRSRGRETDARFFEALAKLEHAGQGRK